MSEAEMMDSTPENWREVEGAEGPLSAVWLTLNRGVGALDDIGHITDCLLHLAVSPNAVKEETWNFLAMELSYRHDAVATAAKAAAELIRPLSQAERTKAEAASVRAEGVA
jgi:hypothetical protein